MRRPQFSIKTLLRLMAVVAAFCAGMIWQRERDSARIIDADYEGIPSAVWVSGLLHFRPTH